MDTQQWNRVPVPKPQMQFNAMTCVGLNIVAVTSSINNPTYSCISIFSTISQTWRMFMQDFKPCSSLSAQYRIVRQYSKHIKPEKHELEQGDIILGIQASNTMNISPMHISFA